MRGEFYLWEIIVIRTVTLNTGFDIHFDISGLIWGDVTRVLSYRSVPSGKGVNMSRMINRLGGDTVCYAIVGSDVKDSFSVRLSAEGITNYLVSIAGETRHNLTLNVRDSQTIAAHAVGPGFTISDSSPVLQLFKQVLNDVQPGDIVSLNGSLPDGLPENTWANFGSQLISCGANVVVDLQGAALVNSLKAFKALAAKPNESEIEALAVTNDIHFRDDPIISGLRMMADLGVKIPLVTLSAKGVALLIDNEFRLCRCPVDNPRLTVGAGDAFLAGLTVALDRTPEDHHRAVHFGLAAAATHVAEVDSNDVASHVQSQLRKIECLYFQL